MRIYKYGVFYHWASNAGPDWHLKGETDSLWVALLEFWKAARMYRQVRLEIRR